MRTPGDAVQDLLAILDGTLTDIPSGGFVKKGKVKEIEYSAAEIGKLMESTAEITGINLPEIMNSLQGS